MTDAVSKSLSDLTKELAKSNNSAKEAQALRLKEQKAQLDQMEQDAKEKGIELKDNKKFRDAQLAHQKADLDFRSKNSTSRAAQIEINKEKSELEESYFKKYLGKKFFFAKGFSSIGDSLRKKVGGGIDSIFKALKAGAFILFLGGLKKFLESDLFQEITDKIIPFIVTGLETLKEWFLYIKDKIPDMIEAVKAMYHQITLAYQKFLQLADRWLPILREKFQFLIDAVNDLIAYMETPEFKDTIKVLKKSIEILASGFGYMRMGVLGIYNTFWDDEGEFKGLEGLKEVFNRISIGFTNIVSRIKDAFYGSDGPAGQRGSEFSWTRGIDQIGVEIKNIAGAFGKVAGSLLFTLGLLAPKKFFGTAFWVARTVILGPTGKILKGFGKLALYLTGFGNSLDDVGNDMRKQNRNFDRNNKPGRRGRGGGIGGKFGKLFGLVGRFGGLIAGVGIGMLAQLDLSKASGVLSDTAKGIGSAFKSLFSVVGDFATSIANVASKATAKVASVVADALSTVKNIGKKPITTTEADARRRLRKASGQSDYQRRLKASKTGTSPKVTTDLGDGANQVRPGPDDISPKVSSAVVAPTIKTKPPNLTTFNTTSPNIPMMDLKSSKITPTSKKLSKEVTEKVLSRSIAKNAAKLALKSVIVVGAVTSGYFALSKLLKGDYIGAAMEGGDIFAPSLVGLPLSTATTIRDIYNESYGTPSNKYPFDKDLVNNPTETNKRLGVIKDQLMKQLGMNKSKRNTVTRGSIAPIPIASSDNNSATKYVMKQNMNYDYNNDGRVSAGERRDKTGAAFGQPIMIASPTVVNNQSSTTNVMSRPITDTSFGGVISAR